MDGTVLGTHGPARSAISLLRLTSEQPDEDVHDCRRIVKSKRSARTVSGRQILACQRCSHLHQYAGAAVRAERNWSSVRPNQRYNNMRAQMVENCGVFRVFYTMTATSVRRSPCDRPQSQKTTMLKAEGLRGQIARDFSISCKG